MTDFPTKTEILTGLLDDKFKKSTELFYATKNLQEAEWKINKFFSGNVGSTFSLTGTAFKKGILGKCFEFEVQERGQILLPPAQYEVYRTNFEAITLLDVQSFSVTEKPIGYVALAHNLRIATLEEINRHGRVEHGVFQ